MKLMTKAVEKKLAQVPYGSACGRKAEVLVKYFNPTGSGTWLITEGRKLENGDWLLFGYCHIMVWEWGSVLLSELENVKLRWGLKIERDLHCEGMTVEELAA